jgi:hypothetical protein
VLHQDGGPIAFYSRSIAPQDAKLATYERELIGLVKAVRHWWPYLWMRPFVVRTNHYTEISAGSTPLHHPAACLGEQVIWLQFFY